jgi:hypothetical protein
MGVSLNHEDSFCRPLPQPECPDSGQWSQTLRGWIWTAQRSRTSKGMMSRPSADSR